MTPLGLASKDPYFDAAESYNWQGRRGLGAALQSEKIASAASDVVVAAAEVGGSVVPGVGETMDYEVMTDSGSHWFERTLAAVSLGGNALTGGALPNIGGILKGGKKIVAGLEQVGDIAPDAKRMNDLIEIMGNRAINAAQDGVQRGGREMVDKGVEGVDRSIDKFTANGGKVKGKEVTLEMESGNRSRVDFVGETSAGKTVAVESKNGPTARLSKNQAELKDTIESGGSVIPRGKNAQNAGFETGKPTKIDDFQEDRH